MIDADHPETTIAAVGREDRALLRSNPSARTGAGTWTGASPSPARRPAPPTLFWPESDKPWGSGGQAPSHPHRAVCHLARSTGLDMG